MTEPTTGSVIKLVVVCRALLTYRVPLMERVAAEKNIDLTFIHAGDFPGTKLRNYDGPVGFERIPLPSFRLSFATRNGSAHIPISRGLWRTLRSQRPDVIVCEGASNLYNNLVCFFFAKFHRIPILQWSLGEIVGRKRSIHRRLADIVFRTIERRSSGAITYSSQGARYFERIGMPRERVTVAVNVVDTAGRNDAMKEYCAERALSLPAPLPKTFHVLSVGSLSENKRTDLLIRAFAKLRDHAPGAATCLTIVGDGSDRERLESLIDDLDLRDSVSMAGEVTQNVASYFYEASVFVLPGLGGLAVSDALVHGVPVLCTIGDGCEQDLVQNGRNGFFEPNLSEDRLAELLIALSEDRKLLERLRAGAIEFIDGPFNQAAYLENFMGAVRRARDR